MKKFRKSKYRRRNGKKIIRTNFKASHPKAMVNLSHIKKTPFRVRKFKKLLNSVAEKKHISILYSMANGSGNEIAQASNGVPYRLIWNLWPASGTAGTNRIGDNIFIRYLTVNLLIGADQIAGYITQPIRVFCFKSKADIANVDYWDQSQVGAADGTYLGCQPKASAPPLLIDKIINPEQLMPRSTAFYQYYQQNTSTTNPSLCSYPTTTYKIFRFKFRIMKNYERANAGALNPYFNHAEYHFGILVGNPTGWYSSAPPTFRIQAKMTFTDV